MADGMSELFEDPEFRGANLTGAASPENLFTMLETFEESGNLIVPFTPFDDSLFISPAKESSSVGRDASTRPASKACGGVRRFEADVDDDEASVARKKLKFAAAVSSAEAAQDVGGQKMSHITVERNRRKQMNEHLAVLRSLMPCFYVKRGDQASIIGGVVDYIKELQQVLQSLEAKKQRKAYSDVLSSPRPAAAMSSPRPLPMSPRPSPLSPRMAPLPISPRTPQPGSPYKPKTLQQQQPYLNSPTIISVSSPSMDSCSSSTTTNSYDHRHRHHQPAAAAANSKSPVADVEVKFSGPNVLLNTVSHHIPGQALKIIATLEGHSLEILQVNINTVDGTMLYSFTIKIGIECELSAEELAQEILQTFS